MKRSTVNLHELVEIKMRKTKGWQGSYYVLPDKPTVCVMKTCRDCREARPVEDFGRLLGARFDLPPRCLDCNQVWNRVRREGISQADSARRLTSQYRRRTDDQMLADRLRIRPTGTKRCKTCKVDKTLDAYTLCRGLGDGLQKTCRVCRASKDEDRRTKGSLIHWNSVGVPLECYICAGPFEEIEHVWCQSSGGPDVPQNTLPVCAECNHGQGGKHTSMLLPYLWQRLGARDASVILSRVVGYGVWPFDEPYVAEDWAIA